MNAQHTKQRRAHDPTPAMEWILGTLGALLFLCGMAFLVVQGAREHDTPGAVSFEVDDIIAVENSYVVRFTAHNHGAQTLSDVEIGARLYDGETILEVAHARIDFLPSHSTRRGGFFLERNPQRFRLEIRAEGFQTP